MKYELYIKNMVCERCKSTVRQTLTRLGFEVVSVELGKIEVSSAPQNHLSEIAKHLQEKGFDLLQDKEAQILGQIKGKLVEYLEKITEVRHNVSDYLVEELDMGYSYLSKLFSRLEGQTIEKYLIRLKIEKVKELLSYQELTLSEIAYRLEYSSVQALSSQFRKVTGISVSEYKEKNGFWDRKELDKV